MKFSKIAVLVLTAQSSTVAVRAQRDNPKNKIVWNTLTETLPSPVSDMTATLIPGHKSGDDDVVLIAGGCSSEKGNEKLGEDFYCTEVTNELFSFHVKKKTFTKLADMPEKRYRHAAIAIYGKLYVVGGRDASDDFVTPINVYDPATNKWSQVRILPDEYRVSDNAALTYEGKLYVVGGYGADYVAQTFMIEIDLDTQGISKKAPMITPRGDANAVSYQFPDGQTVAYIMGGFTHENGFCAALADAESYDFINDKWVEIQDMNFERGDKAVVVHGGRILAIGGERKHEDKCDENRFRRKMGEEGSGSFLIDEIEYYNPLDEEPMWRFENKLTEHRFRAAAVSVKSTNSVYVFGGQSLYSPACKCYPTSDTIFEYTEVVDLSGDKVSPLDSRAVNSSTIGVSLFLLISAAMFLTP